MFTRWNNGKSHQERQEASHELMLRAEATLAVDRKWSLTSTVTRKAVVSAHRDTNCFSCLAKPFCCEKPKESLLVTIVERCDQIASLLTPERAHRLALVCTFEKWSMTSDTRT